MAGNPKEVVALTNRLNDLGQQVSSAGSASIEVRNEIISNAKDLILSLLGVEDYVIQKSNNGMEIGCIRLLMKIGVLEALPENGTISLADLSKKTKAQEIFLERLLRLPVGTKFLYQDEDGKFGHTRFSRGFLGSAGAWFSAALHDIALMNITRYPDFLDAHPEKPVEETTSTHSPWTWRHGMEGSQLFDVFASRPDLLANFHYGLEMMGPMNPVTGYYPFGDLVSSDDRPVIVDVADIIEGGGAGQCLVDIFKAHPEIEPKRAVLQDRPESIELAKKNPQLPGEVVKMVHDFNSPQPVKHARAYYMRMIIHDYLDDICIGILKNLASAMAPDSKVLIAETVVPDRVDEASLWCATMDAIMLPLGGKERTEGGFEELFKASGLKLAKMWRVPGSSQAVVEAVLQ